MLITADDIAERLFRRTSLIGGQFDSIELFGDAKTFGFIHVNNKIKIGIFIHSEVEILDAIEEFMKSPMEKLHKVFERRIGI